LQAATPASANAGHYARIVGDLALLRRLITVSGEIAESAYGQPDDVTNTVPVINIVPDLTLVVGDDGSTTVDPAAGVSGITSTWGGDATVITYADISTDGADGVYMYSDDTATFYNGGVMQQSVGQARWNSLRDQVTPAIQAIQGSAFYEGHWNNWLNRTPTFLTQCRNIGLWPVTQAPNMTPFCGTIPPGPGLQPGGKSERTIEVTSWAEASDGASATASAMANAAACDSRRGVACIRNPRR